MTKKAPKKPDVIELLTKMQEQIIALDKKMEFLVNRHIAGHLDVAIQNAPKPSHPPAAPQPQPNANNRQPQRLMHKTVCAECKKDCEVPFKPSGDRPIFCKECFSRRKSGSAPKSPVVLIQNQVVSGAPALATNRSEPVQVKTPSKQPVTKKKPAPKKAPPAKKKKRK